MYRFLDDNFLLYNDAARHLYHNYAEKLPIIDYHCHVSPKEIAEDKRYSNITELWLGGDHYKWRAMRAAGVDERYITGSASDDEKFLMWAKTVERLPGSPLYHWAHLELQRYFGIKDPLSAKTAAHIYRRCKEMLADADFTPVGLLKRSGVSELCTTDDPFDSLEWHRKIAELSLPFKVRPTFRPDKVVHIRNSVWTEAVKRLGESAGSEIHSYEALIAALDKALRRFKAAGCLAADQGFEQFLYTRETAAAGTSAESVFAKAMRGDSISEPEAGIFESRLLRDLGEMYFDFGICMQIHTGAARNVNTERYRSLGPDTGADNIGLPTNVFKLGLYLDDLNNAGKLLGTILYGLNPADLPVLTSLAVSFCGGDRPGKVQVGSAWWFNDTEAGIRAQLRESAIAGLLGSFVGMVTDSRSFSSFVRHEYFRRILCDYLGDMVENGEYPADTEVLGSIVQDVCFNNAVRFFKD